MAHAGLLPKCWSTTQLINKLQLFITIKTNYLLIQNLIFTPNKILLRNMKLKFNFVIKKIKKLKNNHDKIK